jgi:hypothetical protein
MILTKSPHYITIPWENPNGGTTPTKYILEVYVWNGLKSAVPSTANYLLENINPVGLTGSLDVNISPYINDVLTIATTKGSTTSVINGACAVWVKTQVVYYQDGAAQSPQLIVTDLAVQGYGYGIEGKNPTIPANNVLAFGNFANVSRASQFSLPIQISETLSTGISVISKPFNNINFTTTEVATTSSIELIKKIYVKLSDVGADTTVEIKKDNVLIHTLNVVHEIRYTPFDVYFVNKFGTLYPITFFKEVINTLKTTSEKYESSNGQPIDGVHQFVEYNKKGRKSFTAKTGFILEENNENIEQLMLADTAWILEGEVFNPITVSKSSLEEQTRQKDRLLNYEFEFEYAYNHINNA